MLITTSTILQLLLIAPNHHRLKLAFQLRCFSLNLPFFIVAFKSFIVDAQFFLDAYSGNIRDEILRQILGNGRSDEELRKSKDRRRSVKRAARRSVKRTDHTINVENCRVW